MELDNISQLILKVLKKGDFSGLEIIEQIKEETKNTVVVTQPVLYTTLRELEKEKYILSFWQTNEDQIKMHYYFLTPLGDELLNFLSKENNPGDSQTSNPTLMFPDVVSKDLSGDVDNFFDLEKNEENFENDKTISILEQRKKQKEIKEQLEAEEIKAFMENSSENKFFDLHSENEKSSKPKKIQKYLLINKMNFLSQTILLLVNVFELLAFLIVCFLLNNLGLEQLIILSSIFALSLSFFFAKLYDFSTQKNKKIQQEVKWLKQLIIRCVVFVLLVVFTISIVLITGSQNILEHTALFRWLIPSVYFLNIIFKWIILKILSKKEKYITE